MFLKTIFKNSQNLIKTLRNYSNYKNVLITEQKVDIGNDLSINYVKSTANVDAKKAVICMPGSCGSSWSDFKPQIENLPPLLKDYHLFAWDPPGYGRSIPPKRKFTTDFLEKDADYVDRLMKTLGYPKYSVIGWSDGGHSALLLAGKYPESVDKLVGFATNAFVTREEFSHFESIRDISKWSKKKLDIFLEMYGAERFQEMWTEWLDIYHVMLKET
jgi:valacyclovir hydrolase